MNHPTNDLDISLQLSIDPRALVLSLCWYCGSKTRKCGYACGGRSVLFIYFWYACSCVWVVALNGVFLVKNFIARQKKLPKVPVWQNPLCHKNLHTTAVPTDRNSHMPYQVNIFMCLSLMMEYLSSNIEMTCFNNDSSWK